MSALLSLPDDICLALLGFCTCATRLSLEATCRRMRQLLQLPGAWPLELGAHSRLTTGSQRMAVEAVHAARTEHVLRALVDELVHRNDPLSVGERGLPTRLFSTDPLSGRDDDGDEDAPPRVHPKLFELLCEACRRGSATTIAALRTLDQLVLVVEVRRFSARGSDLAEQCWSWVVQPSADDRRTNHMVGQIRVAEIEVAADEVAALPFTDNIFVVVWAVHRATKAVALVHAAGLEGSGSSGEDAPGAHPAGEEVSGGWHAASLLPRWHPQACDYKVTEVIDHGGRAAYRDSMTLSAALVVRPAWVRAGSAATDMLIDPRDVPGEIQDEEALSDELREETGANFAATAWRPRRMEITLQVEGFANAAGRPNGTSHPDLPYFQPERFLGESEEEHDRRCARNMADCQAPRREAGKSWVRGAVVAQLATNALWMAPRAYRSKTAIADGSEEEEDFHFARANVLNDEPEAWEQAAELRQCVKNLLRHASAGSYGEDDDFDEDGEYDFDEDDDWDDDAGWDEDLAVAEDGEEEGEVGEEQGEEQGGEAE